MQKMIVQEYKEKVCLNCKKYRQKNQMNLKIHQKKEKVCLNCKKQRQMKNKIMINNNNQAKD